MGAPLTAGAEFMVDDLRERVEAGLGRLFPAERPEMLYAPARYVLAGGGKRVRPVLVMLTARMFGAASDGALPAALAVEVFHNFTLVHDDIMDRADTRRGRATVHRAWNEPIAILVGDLLMGEAYKLLAASPSGDLRAMMECFSDMVARLCEGQTLDMAFESRASVSVDEYRDMIARKTGALLECAFELGGHIGGASEGTRGTLREIGYALGQAFQIQDDLLDLVADDDAWGKPIGGDLVEGKKTYLLLRAIEQARGDDAAFFERLVHHGGIEAGRVAEARRRMDRLGVLDDAVRTVQRHTEQALEALGTMPSNSAREALVALITHMARRAR